MKKTIATLTFHDADNYGAVLQAYALQATLIDLGCNVVIVDYRGRIKERQTKTSIYNAVLGSLLEQVKRVLMYYNNRKRKNRFDEFRKKYMHISCDTFRTYEEISVLDGVFDAYIVGSDQVWNPRLTGADSVYYLSFVSDHRKKFSYAASIGINSLTDQEKTQMLHYISDFQVVSVREIEAKILLGDSLVNKTQVHLDPTLLLTKERWLEIAGEEKESGYILVYALRSSDSLYQFVSNLAKEKKLPVKVIAMGMRRNLDAEYVTAVGPKEFLALFANAKYVVTNSFHGLAFAINMQVDFFVETLKGTEQPNSRFENLLSILKLENRQIINGKCNSLNDNIDYNRINSELALIRNQSISYLKQIVDA